MILQIDQHTVFCDEQKEVFTKHGFNSEGKLTIVCLDQLHELLKDSVEWLALTMEGDEEEVVRIYHPYDL